jgi:hypothetical protein
VTPKFILTPKKFKFSNFPIFQLGFLDGEESESVRGFCKITTPMGTTNAQNFSFPPIMGRRRHPKNPLFVPPPGLEISQPKHIYSEIETFFLTKVIFWGWNRFVGCFLSSLRWFYYPRADFGPEGWPAPKKIWRQNFVRGRGDNPGTCQPPWNFEKKFLSKGSAHAKT